MSAASASAPRARSCARLALLAAGLALVTLVACGTGQAERPTLAGEGNPSGSHATEPTTTTLPGIVSLVAQAKGSAVGIYDSPTAVAPARALTNPQPEGEPLVFLVAKEQGDWLDVFLPVRPNGSMGWIKASEVDITEHNFHIVVELSAHRITVYQGLAILDQEPIGVGKHDTPTPGGVYYTKELLQPPDPNGPYGPYAYGLSGFSDVLPNFAGGQGVIGIHGTNEPSAIGHDVSHGCIRMSNAGITRLAHILPLGVPVEIRP